MKILGFNLAKTHYGLPLDNGGACLIVDGTVKMMINEERLNRKQYSPGFAGSINYILTSNNLSLDDIDLFIASSCLEPVRTPQDAHQQLLEYGFNVPLSKIRVCGHHLSHAYSAFYPSQFYEALIVVADGDGNALTNMLTQNTDNEKKYWHNTFEHSSYYIGRGNAIELLERENIGALENGFGGAYRYFTYFCGFPGYKYAGKLMGLSAYGYQRNTLKNLQLFDLLPEGRVRCLLSDTDRSASSQVVENWLQERGISIKARQPGDPISNEIEDVAYFVQREFNRALIHKITYLVQKTGLKNLCIAGGVGLNAVTNKAILDQTGIKNIFIQPAAGDSGQCLGNAYYGLHMADPRYTKKEPISVYQGKNYSDDEILNTLKNHSANITYQALAPETVAWIAAEKIAANHIVAWFQERSEIGPRALGNRSILANPCNIKMKEILNSKVKHRESFRPFAPSVLEEKAAEWFDLAVTAPYMIMNASVKQPDIIPAVTHEDGSARIQTVNKTQNKCYYQLLQALNQLTSVPVVLNTSFNDNEAIVETPNDALQCFLRTGIDYLFIGNYIIQKKTTADKKTENSFEELTQKFTEYKNMAGNPRYVACFGKTFIESDRPEYSVAKNIGQKLVENGYGVLHGGYSGIMEAVNRGAENAIRQNTAKNAYWNIGVPINIFDRELSRSSTINLPAASDIIDRQRALITLADACVVFPSGGFGTLTEILMLFHLNQIAAKFITGPIKPIICLGSAWKNIFTTFYKELDLNKQNNGENFLYFINSADEIPAILAKHLQ